MPSLVLIRGQQYIKCASVQQFGISQKMHADERPKLHLATTREIMWRPPDNHTLLVFRINDHKNIKK